MEIDRRIVPEQRVSYLLEEETISERTIAVKKLLHSSPDKIHHVAHTWMGHSGLNPMARIIIHHVPNVPRRQHAPHTTQTHQVTHEVHHKEPFLHHHEHSSEDHHTLHEHRHLDEHSQVGHSTHDTHNHGSHHDGGNEHAHRGGSFSGFVSTGHWFGDQGAYIFGMIGRLIGEIIGYIFKILALLIIFGPTRTTLLVFLVSIGFNIALNISLPIWIMSGIAGIIHLVFTGMSKVSGGGNSESHGSSSGHGHGGGHGGGHGHH